MTIPATPEEIRAILGELDPIVCEQILQIDATANEIAEAYGAFEADRSGGGRGELSPRAMEALAILENEFDDLEEREWNYPVTGTA